MSHLLALAPELQEQIFSLCRNSDLKNLACCSSLWKKTLKERIWRTVKIPYTSLVRKNFSFFASKKKFKNLRFTQTLCFIDDTTRDMGEGIKCPVNFYKILKYCNIGLLDSCHLEGVFVDDQSVKSCCELFLRLKKLSIVGRTNTIISPDVFSIISKLYCLRELNFGGILVRLDILNITNIDMSTVGLVNFIKMESLVELVITDCNINDFGLSHVSTLAMLRKIDISGSLHVTDEGISHLKTLMSLKELYLSCVGVTDLGLHYISCITSLEYLDVGSTQVTNDGLKCLSKLAFLRDLNINACINITDPGISNISTLISLRKLNISGTKVTENGILDLNLLKNLRELDIHGCYSIRDSAMSHMASFHCLETLNISNNRVTDFGLKDLCKLKTLKRLKCLHTQITEQGLCQLDKRIMVDHDNTGTGHWWP